MLENEEFLDEGADLSDSDEDQDVDQKKHNKLIDAISSLDGKKRHNANLRQEAAQEVSDFSIGPTSDKSKVKLHDLVGALQHTTAHGDLKKQVSRVQENKKVLSVPLSKPEHERIQRSVAYEITAKEVSKWEDTVKQNRKADQLKFPLHQPRLDLQTSDQFVKRFQASTPLEMEIAALLHGSQNVFKKDKMLTRVEERALRAMSLEEAKKRRAELQKHRALLSYKETKARRQNKIKSKNFHRILRKEKTKETKKAMEELQKSDPQSYMQKLKQIEKERIQERMSLKHRGGSRFMQKQIIFGKYDQDGRQAVQEMIQKNKELSQKQRIESESDESDDDNGDDKESAIATDDQTTKSYNPWMSEVPLKKMSFSKLQPVVNQATVTENNSACEEDNEDSSGDEDNSKNKVNKTRNKKTSSVQITKISDSEDLDEESDADNIEEIFSNIEKKEQLKDSSKNLKVSNNSEKRKGSKIKANTKRRQDGGRTRSRKKERESSSSSSESESESDSDDELAQKDDSDDGGLISASLTRKRTLDDLDADFTDDEEDVPAVSRKGLSSASFEKVDNPTESTAANSEEVRVDPKKFLTLETRINRAGVPDLVEGDGEGDDDDPITADDQQRMTIAQAFADDDVIGEFAVEKNATVERDKPKDIDLTLPGWGEWGGTGVKPSKRKKKRFIIKAPDAPPRRDSKLDNVIISETKDNSIAKHQISDLPFPFTNVSQFEASIRAPVGQMWNTQKAFKQLTKPKVLTKLGSIIDPVNKDTMFKNKKNRSEPWDPPKKKKKKSKSN